MTRPAPLFARDRVVAGWLGLGAWLVFTAGALVITTLRHPLEPSLLAVVVVLAVLAAAHRRAARRARAALLRRKTSLPRQKTGTEGPGTKEAGNRHREIRREEGGQRAPRKWPQETGTPWRTKCDRR